MSDSSPAPPDEPEEGARSVDRRGEGAAGPPSERDAGDDGDDELEALRREVEAKYDFDDFGPEDMARMTMEEWEAAFDPDSWIVGRDLIDRVEKELKGAIARRDVFAKVERYRQDGETRLVAYSDEGYAIVYPDGSVEGRGTVLRDVKPIVALCSMDSFEVSDPPADFDLPDPTEVPEASGEFGNLMLQIVAGVQLLVGLALLGIWLYDVLIAANDPSLQPLVGPPAGVVNLVPLVIAGVMIVVGLFLFTVVANARLSDRFRAEEYRNRLRAVGLEDGERPDFLPPLEDERPEAGGGGNLRANEADSDRPGALESDGREV
jgi:hypothetical protein